MGLPTTVELLYVYIQIDDYLISWMKDKDLETIELENVWLY